MATKKKTPSWSDVKTKLADFDRDGLIGLVGLSGKRALHSAHQ